MERLAQKNGWFAPVSTILDYLKEQNRGHILTNQERFSLECKWLWNKLRIGGTT